MPGDVRITGRESRCKRIVSRVLLEKKSGHSHSLVREIMGRKHDDIKGLGSTLEENGTMAFKVRVELFRERQME